MTTITNTASKDPLQKTHDKYGHMLLSLLVRGDAQDRLLVGVTRLYEILKIEFLYWELNSFIGTLFINHLISSASHYEIPQFDIHKSTENPKLPSIDKV